MAYQDALDALGDGTRRQVFAQLRRGPMAVGAIARRLPVSRPAVSQHLRVLEGAGLVRHESQGTRNLYLVDARGLSEMREWLDGFWDEALARFAQHVDKRGGHQVGRRRP